MLPTDPDLNAITCAPGYREAVEHGFPGLRFVPALEHQFQSWYAETHLKRTRLAGYMAILFFATFALVDIATLPPHVAKWAASIRLGIITPSILIPLLVTYRAAWHHRLQDAITFAALVSGIGTVAIVGTGLRQGYQIPYEGLLLVTLFIFLIACLLWWRALAVNLLTLTALVAMEILYQKDAQALVYQIIFMLAANAIGACGSYFLEHSVRTGFLVNALLNQLAERDSLTGLFNRRSLDSHLDRVWRQLMREEKSLAIAMIDIDHFKRYNDRYGHARGDAALRAVAAAIAHQARRPMDLAARYGGEEFVVVWYNPVGTEVANMAEHLRAAVAGLNFVHEGSELGTISVSVGVAHIDPAAGISSATLLRAADMALYDAKNQGRNQVVIRTSPVE